MVDVIEEWWLVYDFFFLDFYAAALWLFISILIKHRGKERKFETTLLVTCTQLANMSFIEWL